MSTVCTACCNAHPQIHKKQGPVVCQVAALSKAGKEPDINPKINQDAWLTTWLTIPLTDFGQHAAQQQRQQQQGRQQEHPSTINTTHVHVNATAHATASAAAGGAAGFNKQDVFHCMVFGVMDGHGPEGVPVHAYSLEVVHAYSMQRSPSHTTHLMLNASSIYNITPIISSPLYLIYPILYLLYNHQVIMCHHWSRHNYQNV